MFNLWENAKGSISEVGKPKGRLIIGAEESICGFKLPELLKEYNMSYPVVELVIRIGTGCKMESMLRENSIHVAVFSDNKVSAQDLVVEMEHDEPFALLTSSNHILAQKKYINAEDFSEYPYC